MTSQHLPPQFRSRLHRLAFASVLSIVFLFLAVASLSRIQAWSEEAGLHFYDPSDPVRELYTDTVSSVHFDLVGALAIAAGFSEEDAAVIQIYSELTDPGVLPDATGEYSFTATTYPEAPSISEVVTSTYCPSPSTTADVVTMGGTGLIECDGCFTSRFGPYSVFFHEPHDTESELGAIEKWAFGTRDVLTGVVTFGYSGTVPSPLIPPDSPLYTATLVANVYESTPCFVTQTVQVDTGDVQAGSLEALGVYLHSLGDSWSHRACIQAADAQGKPFGAHVAVSGPDDPLWDCRWTSHMADFGGEYATDTYSGTLAIYDALVEYANASGRAIYHSIPITAENNYIQSELYKFAYDTKTGIAGAHRRRAIAGNLRRWAQRTRTIEREYWLEPPLEVCASGCSYTTINVALSDAQAGDTIFVHPGIYTETIELTPTVNIIGTPALTVLERDGTGPVVRAVNENITHDTVFGGFVVQGGVAEQGAGIYIANGASPSLMTLVVRKNTDGGASESAGAGLFVTGTTSAPRLEFSTFFSNTADTGAGLYAHGAPVEARYTAFELNTASDSGGAIALFNTTATVYSNTFVLNVSQNSGGALYINGGSPTVDTNLIAGANSAVNAGGGIVIDGGTALVQHNRIISNTAGVRGAGLAVSGGGAPTIHNNLIAGNKGAGVGDGMSIEGASGVVRNNTIADNDGDGMYLIGSASAPTITNNIVTGNTYGVRAQDTPVSKPAPTLRNNDVWDNVDGDLVGENVESQAGDNLSEDPLFVLGPLGRFYLSHAAAGQSATSGLFDAGEGTAGNLRLDMRTMRTDNTADAGTVDIGYHYPIAGPLATRIYSATGGIITFTTGITLIVEFPANAVTDTITLEMEVTEGHPISRTQRQIGSAFSIEAYDSSGSSVTNFAEPFTVTIEYQGDDVKYLDESSVGLYYWDEGSVSMKAFATASASSGTWRAVPTTADFESNVIWTTLDHLTEFAVLAEGETLAESHFDKSSEGWRVSGDVQRGTGRPDYVRIGGHPGGHLQAEDDVQGGTWYWVAPSKFLGDVSAAYSTTLRFDLKQKSGMNDQYNRPDIILTGYVNDRLVELGYNTRINPREFWTPYAVLLHESAGWRRLRDGNLAESATQGEMLSVLSSLVKIEIRGEFEDGADTGYLDNVVLGAPVPSLVVDPDAGLRAMLETEPPGLIDFPGGAVSDAITLTVGITTGHPVTPGLGVLGQSFVIEARDSAGTPVTQFQAPFTLTLQYEDTDAYGLDEQSLKLYYWGEGDASVRAATTSASSGTWRALPTTFDLESNVIWTTLDHLTEFAVIGDVRCPDVNEDGRVDIVDIMLIATHWGGPYDARYDVNGDADIDLDDIVQVAAGWRGACSP